MGPNNCKYWTHPTILAQIMVNEQTDTETRTEIYLYGSKDGEHMIIVK